MPDIAVDAGTGLSVGASPLTFAHTCAGAYPILFVGVYSDSGSDLVTGVTYAGVAMLRAGAIVGGLLGAQSLYLYALATPALGANNVVITAPGATLHGRSLSYINAAQRSLVDNLATNSSASATSIAAAVTPKADRCWVVGMLLNGGSNTVTPAGGTSLRPSPPGGDGSGSIEMADSGAVVSPAASTSLGYSWAGAAAAAAIVASFAPVRPADMFGVLF